MKITLCQINSHLGNFESNFLKIKAALIQAQSEDSDLVIFPELSLLGYPPQDLLERPGLLKTTERWIKKIQNILPAQTGVVLGSLARAPQKASRPYLNAALFLERGKAPKVIGKKCLPQYDIFDETRFFVPGDQKSNVIKFKGQSIHISICEDMWSTLKNNPHFQYDDSPFTQNLRGVDLFLNLSASPFVRKKIQTRHEIALNISKKFKAPFVYVTCVGAQDEIIFDGGSFVAEHNQISLQLPQFVESIQTFNTESTNTKPQFKRFSPAAELVEALVVGIRDYVTKSGFQKVHLGMSGGIDSAVVASLAVKALGRENVKGFGLPGPFSDKKSLEWAALQAQKLQIDFSEIPIGESYSVLKKQFEKNFEIQKFGLMHENLQSRLRGLTLMAYSNAHSSMLLTTGNKVEYATGYATLYGDMNGALAPLGDCLKGEVYELARELNRQGYFIPVEVIDRAPSAELRPNQKDSDSLPEYPKLDRAVKNIVEKARPAKNPVEKWLYQVLIKTEFKRWQAAPILRVSQHAFGRGRRWPLAHKFSE